MREMRLLVAVIFIGSALAAVSFSLGQETGPIAAAASAFYAVLVTLFLVAQVYGFVVSQVHYSESVEEAKFEMLEKELSDKTLPNFVEGG